MDNEIAADFNFTQSSKVEFSIFNALGMLMTKENSIFESGNNHKVFNANLPIGLCFVKIATNGQAVTSKVMK